VPELEGRELENGTRLCQGARGRPSLLPCVKEDEGSRCERASLSQKGHFLKELKEGSLFEALPKSSKLPRDRIDQVNSAQRTGSAQARRRRSENRGQAKEGIQRWIGCFAQTWD